MRSLYAIIATAAPSKAALNESAQKLLDGAPPDFVLEEDGPQYVGTDTAALPWRLGPPGNPAARGSTFSQCVTAA